LPHQDWTRFSSNSLQDISFTLHTPEVFPAVYARYDDKIQTGMMELIFDLRIQWASNPFQ
jgi:hypothetical protein